MVELNITKNDFKILKTIPPVLRVISAFLLAISGIMIQIFLPIQGIYPYEMKTVSYVSFFVGLVLIVLALLFVLPERAKITEEPKTVDSVPPVWEEISMKQLSNVFNVINKRKQKEKNLAAFFDLTKPNLCDNRLTCVSTTTPSAIPKAVPNTTLAVFRATPGKATSSSIERGKLFL